MSAMRTTQHCARCNEDKPFNEVAPCDHCHDPICQKCKQSKKGWRVCKDTNACATTHAQTNGGGG